MKKAEPCALRELLKSVQLPALPLSALNLIQLSRDSETGPEEYAIPIEADPGLTVQLLQFVNSSYFGFRQKISNVKLAIALVGVRTIRNFAICRAVFGLMPNPRCGQFQLRRLWQDSLRRGMFARTISEMAGCANPEELFTAALLQDVALPVLVKAMPDSYREILALLANGELQSNGDTQASGGTRLSDVERERFGWTHAEAGGRLASLWSLPESFAQLISSHTDAATSHNDCSVLDGRRIVAMSALLPSSGSSAWHERDAFLALFSRLIEPRSIVLADVLARVDGEFDRFAQLLKLGFTSHSLVDSLVPVHDIA